MKHLNLTPEQFCAATKACEEGRVFAITQQTMADVWSNCSRPDWLVWMLEAINAPKDDEQLRLFAVWCARNTPMPDGRTTGALLTDPRSISALEVAERYAHGMATVVELGAARAAAWAAAEDAAQAAARYAAHSAARAAAEYAAGDAAWAAARDAAHSAARAAAEYGAGDAAWAAAWAAEWTAARAAEWTAARGAEWAAARYAEWAAARDAAQAAAWDAAWDAQADQLRKMIPNPFAQGGDK